MFNIRKIVNKTGRSLLAFVLACSCMLGAIPSSAFAADTKNVKLREGLGTVSYGGYSTTKAKALDGWAYCLQPDAATPASGTYSATETNDDSLKAALWFATKGCGYDENLMPNKAWNGNDFGNTHLYAALHVLLARIYTGSIGTALSGVSAEFTTWFRQYFWGYDADWEVLNENAYWQKVKKRKDEVPSTFKVWIIKTGSATQNMIAYEYDTTPITIKKSSNNTSITNNNDMYSLKGAEFTVYDYDKSESDKCGDKVCVFVSDKNGDCTVSWPNEYEGEKYFDVVPGEKYRVKETNVPTGYIGMDAKNFTANKNNKVWDCDNTPQVVDINLTLQKMTDLTNSEKGAEDYPLNGAVFKFTHYGSNCTAETPSGRKTTWYFETDTNGQIKFDKKYLANGYSSANFYTDNNKNICLPLGTLFIEEVLAPVHYIKSDEIQVLHFNPTTSQKNIVYTNKLLKKNTRELGDFRLVKEVSIDYDEQNPDKERILVDGIKFELYSDNVGEIYSPQFNSNVSKGGLVCTIVTDENGLASTKNDDVNGWSNSYLRKELHGYLQAGTYHWHEVIPDEVQQWYQEKYGHKLYPADDQSFTIDTQGQYDAPQLVNNGINHTPLKIVKKDSETGKTVPLSCSFKLYRENGELVTYTTSYPKEHTIDTWTSTDEGEVTLPMQLTNDTYYIEEVSAPDGYVLAKDKKAVSGLYEYQNGWDSPFVLEFANTPQKGKINLSKTDATIGKAVANCVYEIVAAQDITTPDGTIRAKQGDVIQTLTTDKEGKATSQELYLGSYIVKETKTASGYTLNQDSELVTLEYQGQDVDVFTHDLSVQNEPTNLKIKKVDSTVQVRH